MRSCTCATVGLPERQYGCFEAGSLYSEPTGRAVIRRPFRVLRREPDDPRAGRRRPRRSSYHASLKRESDGNTSPEAQAQTSTVLLGQRNSTRPVRVSWTPRYWMRKARQWGFEKNALREHVRTRSGCVVLIRHIVGESETLDSSSGGGFCFRYLARLFPQVP